MGRAATNLFRRAHLRRMPDERQCSQRKGGSASVHGGRGHAPRRGVRPAAAAYPRPGLTERMSVASDGTEGEDLSLAAAVSADGRLVAFYSQASNLVTGDTNGARRLCPRFWRRGLPGGCRWQATEPAHAQVSLSADTLDQVLAEDALIVADDAGAQEKGDQNMNRPHVYGAPGRTRQGSAQIQPAGLGALLIVAGSFEVPRARVGRPSTPRDAHGRFSGR